METDENQFLNIAVVGCCHGELDTIYREIRELNRRGRSIELLLVCGDFQCVRSKNDLNCVAVPQKYRRLNTFHEYVNGTKEAAVPTIFIGGNHEASNILQSLYLGGYVAPNIYFLGFAGCVNFGGVRIAGLSGIYNPRHYHLGRYERPPYSEDTLRSIYHLREVEVYRMTHLAMGLQQTAPAHPPVDIFLSHDWPLGIWDYGDKFGLLRRKPYFRSDMEKGELGSPPLQHLLQLLQPEHWFAAHLHVKFAALVQHNQQVQQEFTDRSHKGGEEENKGIESVGIERRMTRFLALDKVLPRREYMEVVRVRRHPLQRPCADRSRSSSNHGSAPTEASLRVEYPPTEICFDAEWMAIMRRTHELTTSIRRPVSIPQTLTVIEDEVKARIAILMRQYSHSNSVNMQQEILRVHEALAALTGSEELVIPNIPPESLQAVYCEPIRTSNLQTDRLLGALGLTHVWTVPCSQVGDDGGGFFVDRDGARESQPTKIPRVSDEVTKDPDLPSATAAEIPSVSLSVAGLCSYEGFMQRKLAAADGENCSRTLDPNEIDI